MDINLRKTKDNKAYILEINFLADWRREDIWNFIATTEGYKN